jgi:aerobic carbon-monoxide dehydrogenase medium subunit
MKAAAFDYHRPASVDAAVGLLAELGDEAKVLAGGQSLVPVMAMRLGRPEHIVDVNRVAELEGVTRSDGTLRVGALTRHRALERDEVIAGAAPLLTRAAPYIGHFQIRNRGTLGGSLAHADPAAELPAVAVALDAGIEVRSARGTRRVPAGEFFVSAFMTALEPDELVTALHVPVWARAAEEALAGASVGEVDLDGLARDAVAPLRPASDAHGSGAYRRRAGAHMIARALGRALAEAQDREEAGA